MRDISVNHLFTVRYLEQDEAYLHGARVGNSDRIRC